jgi:lysophospholipase L1-like esterase
VHGLILKKRLRRFNEADGFEGETGLSQNKEIHIIAIGESSLVGIGISNHQKSFIGQLAHYMAIETNRPVKWKVYANRGFNTNKINQQIIPKISVDICDLIVIGIGANDAFEFVNLQKWKNNIKNMIHSLRVMYPKSTILFINMPPIKMFPAFILPMRYVFGNIADILRKELKKLISNQENILFNDETIKLTKWVDKYHSSKNPKDYFIDGIHPSPLTFKLWAKETVGFIKANKIVDKL